MSFIIKKVNFDKNHKGKTLQLITKIQNGLIKILVDISVFMLIMAIGIVRKLGIMHLNWCQK